jgi:hypothetical protein
MGAKNLHSAGPDAPPEPSWDSNGFSAEGRFAPAES